MRGQRSTLPAVWAWLAVLAMLLGGVLPALQGRMVQSAGAASTVQVPAEERGGEGSSHETAPAKLRRIAPPPAPSQPPTVIPVSALLAEPWLASFPLLAAAPVLRGDWPRAEPHTPLAERPGRRVQRGQAPPLG